MNLKTLSWKVLASPSVNLTSGIASDFKACLNPPPPPLTMKTCPPLHLKAMSRLPIYKGGPAPQY